MITSIFLSKSKKYILSIVLELKWDAPSANANLLIPYMRNVDARVVFHRGQLIKKLIVVYFYQVKINIQFKKQLN